MALGKRIKAARAKAGLSLRAMEEMTGISASKLSKVENGKSTLTHPDLIAASECLNVPVTALLTETTRALVPSGRRAITRADTGPKFEKVKKIYQVLCGEMSQKDNYFWRVVIRDIAPGTEASYTSHPGEEFILVLKGTLELHTALYEPVTLREGDSILFDAEMAHAYFTSSGPEVEILLVNSVPH